MALEHIRAGSRAELRERKVPYSEARAFLSLKPTPTAALLRGAAPKNPYAALPQTAFSARKKIRKACPEHFLPVKKYVKPPQRIFWS